ncbi:MAG: MFS transporter, partial [Rubrivivax sp.]|nr:MFS transporter [Rubrivivax sp.]
AVLLLAAIALIAWLAPRDPAPEPGAGGAAQPSGYRAIVRHPLFVRMAPLAFFTYGGMIAVQALWAGPWMTRVTGASPDEAASGLFAINLSMLFTFMVWGALLPHLTRRGLGAVRLITWGVPVSLVVLAAVVLLGSSAGAAHWALWCVSSTFVALCQPAVGQAFPAAQAGRALSAFNLVIFGGVFCLQWGIGLLIDAFQAAGLTEIGAFQAAFGAFWVCCTGAFVWFVVAPRVAPDNAG